MDVYVKLSQMSLDDFEAHFGSLNSIDRLNFVSQRRQEILDVSNVKILMELCFNGFFDALLPITEKANRECVLKAFERVYAPWACSPVLGMTKENEIKVLKFAASNLYVADFMYNKLHFLNSVKTKSRWIEGMIFQNASKEVLDFLFSNIAKDGVIISKSIGDILLGKGTIEAIKKYVKKVRYLGVKQSYITITALRQLKERTDFDLDTKREITYFLLNRLVFSGNTVYKVRKLGLID